MNTADLLLEIGTEELPPGLLPRIAQDLGRNLAGLLRQSHLEPGEVSTFAAPRRIAVIIRQLPERQPDRDEVRLGPPVAAARDTDGRPTPAGAGFARSCGVPFEALQETTDGKGPRLSHTRRVAGQDAVALLPELVAQAAHALEIPRRMRWGSRDDEFVRPVHWLLLLLGGQLVPASLWGVQSGRETRGHRFHAPQALTVDGAGEYERTLETAGKVVPDFDRRRDRIRTQVEALAAELGGQAMMDADLLNEVTALVEWPVALSGRFDERFLAVPQEALITTMCANQKYFPVLDPQGRLMPVFILVSNLESAEPALVRAGNERVIRPRFADAEFFFTEDRRKPLSQWAEGLDALTYQSGLGSIAERSRRIATVAAGLAPQCGATAGAAESAGLLCKADLLTLMVQEFPKLQGIMGRYYAAHEGLPEDVALAIEEHYLPRHADDRLPASALGRALALADRIELLAGFFALGRQPTGDKDPYGLRRAALGMIRILADSGMRLDLAACFATADTLLPAQVAGGDAPGMAVDFVMQRVAVWLQGQGVPADALHAVAAKNVTDVVDFIARARAMQSFQSLPAAAELAAANKRVANILSKSTTGAGGGFDEKRLKDPAEQELYRALCDARDAVAPLLGAHRYVEVLERLAQLRECISRFFDEVMVNCEDAALRENRLALLGILRALFLEVADVSLLQGADAG